MSEGAASGGGGGELKGALPLTILVHANNGFAGVQEVIAKDK